jgi:xanthine dehydrogenase accessory factor
MRDLVRQIIEGMRLGREQAYCRLVETRGSTPQKAGALMIVHPDGSQGGTLGGGCVEADVKRRALAALAARSPEVATFQLDSDYGWDDGLICGGRMRILILPLDQSAHGAYFERLGRIVERGHAATEAIVFDGETSGLAATTTYLFDGEDHPAASLNGAAGSSDVPPLVLEHLRPIASRPRPYAARGVAYLPILPRCRLLIVGGGHVGKAVGDLAAELDFEVWVVDDRDEYVSAERFPRAERRIAGPIGRVLPEIEVTPDTLCLIVTRGHNHDEEALFHLADRGARYVGLIGSRRKIKLIFDDLLNEGLSAEALRRVHAPVGIDIGSQTVPEIAVSICAELVAVRNKGEAVLKQGEESPAAE